MSVEMEEPSMKGTRVSKRKRDEDLAELEVDINAAEPPSKKALRKAKRNKPESSQAEQSDIAEKTASQQAVTDKTQKANTARSQWGIWIGNLSFTTNKEDLKTFITSDEMHKISEDSITRINLPQTGPKNGKEQNKGFAYIDFDSEETLKTALELSEKLLSGRRVLIKNAKSFEGRPERKEQIDSTKPPSRKVFIGNLAFDTTQEMLEKHFGVCGAIQKIQVATFEDSGKCKGYAWVEFEQLSAAQAAMRGWVEQGSDSTSKRRVWLKKLDGRQLRMEFAEDSTTRYNKRYGKDAKKPNQQVEGEEDVTAPITEVKAEEESVQRPQQRKAAKIHERKGYNADTVRKLTGGITESQGKKVTFD